MLLPTDLEAVVAGVLMQQSPTTARPHVARLEPGDLTDWRAATVLKLLADMLTAGLPSIDPAAVVGYALRTGALPNEHKLKRVAEWMADAYRLAPLPPASLEFHIDLLIEASYRRHVTVFAKRLQQAEKDGALDLLDDQITRGYARLALHRQRFTTAAGPVDSTTALSKEAAA
ncbi:hypothetical protein GCM10029964_126420 [Kibdelosporangium lantanae]